MLKNKTKKPTWTDLKKEIIKLNHSQMISLIKDLYRLSKSNRDFLHVRFSIGKDRIDPYKKIIEDAMYPDIYKDKPISISRAKQAISDYSKATDDPLGKIDLMIFLVEWGNHYTLNYGDIDANFYNSLISMYEKAVKEVISLPDQEQEEFRERLKEIMESTSDIGWGYYDGIFAAYYKAFDDED
ncbi:MAG: DUF6155 family protein [Candidatus Hatepunaea meridiana]|nr:DUF6155 family protein [Candidatus Hatepunaea meridiana]